MASWSGLPRHLATTTCAIANDCRREVIAIALVFFPVKVFDVTKKILTLPLLPTAETRVSWSVKYSIGKERSLCTVSWFNHSLFPML
jgi:hypothetical protein